MLLVLIFCVLRSIVLGFSRFFRILVEKFVLTIFQRENLLFVKLWVLKGSLLKQY